MCHYRHYAHDDPFLSAGLQDITAHVDFTAIAEAGVSHGLNLLAIPARPISDQLRHHRLAGTRPRLNKRALTCRSPPRRRNCSTRPKWAKLFKAIALGKGVMPPCSALCAATRATCSDHETLSKTTF